MDFLSLFIPEIKVDNEGRVTSISIPWPLIVLLLLIALCSN